MLKAISGTTQTFCLIAHPVKGSSSPALQNASFEALSLDARFVAYDVLPEHLAEAVFGLKALGITGYSVGVPHKSAIITYLDELSGAARLMQSVNCVVQDADGRLIGHNTDGLGFTESLRNAGIALPGARLAIIDDGAEGPSWIVQAALDGAKKILVLCPEDRLKKEEAWLSGLKSVLDVEFELQSLDSIPENAAYFEDYDALCNGSRIGVGDTLGVLPVPASVIAKSLTVVDANYNPRTTALLARAKEVGCKTIEGLDPLLNQAAVAQRLWLGCELPKEKVKLKLFG